MARTPVRRSQISSTLLTLYFTFPGHLNWGEQSKSFKFEGKIIKLYLFWNTYGCRGKLQHVYHFLLLTLRASLRHLLFTSLHRKLQQFRSSPRIVDFTIMHTCDELDGAWWSVHDLVSKSTQWPRTHKESYIITAINSANNLSDHSSVSNNWQLRSRAKIIVWLCGWKRNSPDVSNLCPANLSIADQLLIARHVAQISSVSWAIGICICFWCACYLHRPDQRVCFYGRNWFGVVLQLPTGSRHFQFGDWIANHNEDKRTVSRKNTGTRALG